MPKMPKIKDINHFISTLIDSERGHWHLAPEVSRCRFLNIQHLALAGIDIHPHQRQMFDRESQRFVGRSILPVGPGQLREDQPHGTVTQAHHLLVIAAQKRKHKSDYSPKRTTGPLVRAGHIRLGKQTLHHIIYGHDMHHESLPGIEIGCKGADHDNDLKPD